MAWTWKYSSSYKFTSYGYYRAWLGYDQVNYANYTRCWYSIGVQMYSSYQWGVTAIASGAKSDSVEGYLSSNPGSAWKDVCRKDGYFDVTRSTSAQTRTIYSTAKGKTVNGIGSAGGSGVSVSYTYTIPALPSYTITYNDNGGSGGPTSQTKYYGISVTLNTSKLPTKDGHKFAGWYTAASGGSKKTSYEGNASVTFYAHWTPNTYTVTYDLNDKTIAGKPEQSASNKPSNQTKTYGVNLTLTSTIPIRKYYIFKGWATSPSGDVVYKAGASFPTNANTTLYAVWEDNWYQIVYSDAVPKEVEGEKIQGPIPEPQYYDFTTEPEYNIDSGAGFTLASNKYYIAYFRFNEKDYGLGAKYSPVKEELALLQPKYIVTFEAVWIQTYSGPTVGELRIGRLDKDGKPSDGGRPFYLQFTAIPAKGPGDDGLVNRDTTFEVSWLAQDGETWEEDTEHWSDTTSNSNALPATNVQKSYYRRFEQDEITKFSKVKILFEDIDPYYQATGVFEEGVAYYTKSGNTYTRVENPSQADFNRGYYYREYENNTYTNEIEIIDRNIIASQKEVSIITSQCIRKNPSHTEVDFNFTWTPYYDGFERFISSVKFYIEATPYEVIDGEIKERDPINLVKEVTYTPFEDNSEFFLEGKFLDDEATSQKGIPVDLNAKIKITRIISESDSIYYLIARGTYDSEQTYYRKVNEEYIEAKISQEDFDSHEYFTKETLAPHSKIVDIPLGEVNLGGFPVHINENGQGISLFGIANRLKGFEVNGSTTINNTLKVIGATNINNSLKISGATEISNTLSISTPEKYGLFINNTAGIDSGIRISRDDKDYHLFVGIGTEGVNHGVWSEAPTPGWMINKDSNTGMIYANNGRIPLNSNNVLWSSQGRAYYMIGSHTMYLNQKITEQMTGIVLVWSSYNPTTGEVHNYDWNFNFIPKWFVQQGFTGGNTGMECLLTNTIKTSSIAKKYIYVYDDRLVGYTNNASTADGLHNNEFILRAVIGV